MKAKRLVFLAIALMAVSTVAIAAPSKSKTKLYKWVDKNGVTQYGSSIPPEYASQQSEQLNSQGAVIKTQEAQKTPEQVAAEEHAKQQAQQDAQAQIAQKAHDKVLLDTYTSVADMERDRDSKLSAIDAQINVLNGSISVAQRTLADFQGRAAELADKNKPVPADVQKHIDTSKQQLILNQQQLLQQQQHKQQVADQFISDIARYKELTGAETASPPSH
jgi:chromosome segregation ATPase